MATVTVSTIQTKRSLTSGVLPTSLLEGEEFVNLADGFRLMGDGVTAPAQLPRIPFIPAENLPLSQAQQAALLLKLDAAGDASETTVTPTGGISQKLPDALAHASDSDADAGTATTGLMTPALAARTTRTLPAGVQAVYTEQTKNHFIEKHLLGPVADTSKSEQEFSNYNAKIYYDMQLLPTGWYGVGAVGYNVGLFAGYYQPFRGSPMGFRAVMFIGDGADDAAGGASGEPCGLALFQKFSAQKANKNSPAWLLDIGVDGPASSVTGAQEAFIGGTYQIHKHEPDNRFYHDPPNSPTKGAAYKRPSSALCIVSAPALSRANKEAWGRADDLPTGVATYPLETVFQVVGHSGSLTTVTDGDQAAATPMANTVIRVGGAAAGGYANPATNAQIKSRFSDILELNDYTGRAIWVRAKHVLAGTTARAIKVEAGGGTTEINDALLLGGVTTRQGFGINEDWTDTSSAASANPADGTGNRSWRESHYQGTRVLLIGTDDKSYFNNFVTYERSGVSPTRMSVFAPFKFAEFTVATVPAASLHNREIICVTNDVGGATLAQSNGTNWRRIRDNANISAT